MVSIAAFPKCWLDEITDGRMDLFDWIDLSAQLECDGLEMYSPFFKSLSPDYLARIRRRIEANGMSMPMMCHSPDFIRPDRDARREEVDRQIKMIRATAALGGSFCRTLSGQRRKGISLSQGTDWVVECIEACLPAAQASGVRLVIENHYKDGSWEYPEFAQKGEVFLAILKRIDTPLLGVQYDPSNALVAGEDPITLLEAVLPRILTCHASDRFLLPGTSFDEMRQADGTLGYPKNLVHGVTGGGLIDYDAVFSRLAGIGFNGWVSIEDGMNGMEEMKASVDFLKSKRSEYFRG